MELYTLVSIPEAAFLFSYSNEIMLLGSCFADEIGRKLSDDKFAVNINPFGTLYNPASISLSLSRLMQPEPFTASDLFCRDGLFHSFAHHSRFSSPSEEEALEGINRQLAYAAAYLGRTSRLIVTFGSAWVYRLKDNGNIVSNCHKLPERMFGRERLSVDAIVNDWDALLRTLWERHPALRVLFTISPVRHWKDGAHANQLSKATLLLAVDELQRRYPERIAYFPAYEIMMDELRDYRFYANDMLHPSALAIEYISERFYRNFLSAESQTLLHEWRVIRKAIEHKPFQPESAAYRQFILQTLLKVENLSGKFPYFDLSRELALLHSKLK
ncbi:MAG: GSCFA domain-containing protein [Tannerellaceae bacterium]|nr:GSCFA domain-containing protein [Tannerellaceae bacterium]